MMLFMIINHEILCKAILLLERKDCVSSVRLFAIIIHAQTLRQNPS